MSREALDGPTVPGADEAQFISGNQQPVTKGRRRVHSTPAARVAAFRASHKRLDFVTNERVATTIASLAEQFDCSKNDVMNSLVRYALTNRNWRQQGLWGMGKQEGEQQ
jgi:hypothetical protein